MIFVLKILVVQIYEIKKNQFIIHQLLIGLDQEIVTFHPWISLYICICAFMHMVLLVMIYKNIQFKDTFSKIADTLYQIKIPFFIVVTSLNLSAYLNIL